VFPRDICVIITHYTISTSIISIGSSFDSKGVISSLIWPPLTNDDGIQTWDARLDYARAFIDITKRHDGNPSVAADLYAFQLIDIRNCQDTYVRIIDNHGAAGQKDWLWCSNQPVEILTAVKRNNGHGNDALKRHSLSIVNGSSVNSSTISRSLADVPPLAVHHTHTHTHTRPTQSKLHLFCAG
jgi:hypothetical protein